MTIEFTVPYPARKSAWTKRYGLNAYWAGKNHHVRAADARDLEALVRLCLRQQGIPVRLFEKPVSISFWHNTRMDVDNHAAIEKMTVDAIKGWLLRNFYKAAQEKMLAGVHAKQAEDEMQEALW